MAQKRIGIRQNSEQVIVSNARVSFDARTTSEVEPTRDPRNYKAEEKGLRVSQWELRRAEKRLGIISDAEAAE